MQWTEQDFEIIKDLRQQGTSYRDIAEIFNTTPGNISSVITRMEQRGYKVLVATSWSEEDIHNFLQLRLQYNLFEISQIMDRSYDSIKKKSAELTKLGLCGPMPKGVNYNAPRTILYLVDFQRFKKVGVTQKSIKTRFSGAPPYEVCDQLYINTREALLFEYQIKQAMRPFAFVPQEDWFARNGSTECFIHKGTKFEELL